jgi:hypothetical protein
VLMKWTLNITSIWWGDYYFFYYYIGWILIVKIYLKILLFVGRVCENVLFILRKKTKQASGSCMTWFVMITGLYFVVGFACCAIFGIKHLRTDKIVFYFFKTVPSTCRFLFFLLKVSILQWRIYIKIKCVKCPSVPNNFVSRVKGKTK